MSDEMPVDLQPLEPDDTPEVVRGAMRRFRWRVVIFTVVAVVTTASLTAWGVAAFVESREIADRSRQLAPAQLAIYDHMGASSCETPTFEVDGIDVGLLQAAPMPDGGWALHLVVHGDGPFASGTGRFMAFTAVGPGARSAQIAAQPGMTWAEAWVTVPGSVGSPFAMELRDLRGEVIGSFMVRPSSLLCDFS
jgi:hypothetical protein